MPGAVSLDHVLHCKTHRFPFPGIASLEQRVSDTLLSLEAFFYLHGFHTSSGLDIVVFLFRGEINHVGRV